MDLNKILSIAGKPGLYKLIAQSKNGLIIESLLDGKRMNAFMNEKISSLEEISLFSHSEDIALKTVFKTIFDHTNGQKAIENKSDDATIKEFFAQIVPDYDDNRVYVSHMRKVIGWYNLLLEKGILDYTKEAVTEQTPEETTEE